MDNFFPIDFGWNRANVVSFNFSSWEFDLEFSLSFLLCSIGSFGMYYNLF